MPNRTYDQFAEQYEPVMRPLDRWFLARLRAATFQYLPGNAHILEIGAGTGLNFVYYPDNTLGVATEPSAEMMRIAERKVRPEGLKLLRSCAEDLPFQPRTFDAAFATLVFCSVESPTKAFRELRRVVKPGGTVLLLEHVRPNNLLGPLFDVANFLTTRLFEDHVNRRTSELARDAGLTVLRVEKSLLGIINLIVCRV